MNHNSNISNMTGAGSSESAGLTVIHLFDSESQCQAQLPLYSIGEEIKICVSVSQLNTVTVIALSLNRFGTFGTNVLHLPRYSNI